MSCVEDVVNVNHRTVPSVTDFALHGLIVTIIVTLAIVSVNILADIAVVLRVLLYILLVGLVSCGPTCL